MWTRLTGMRCWVLTAVGLSSLLVFLGVSGVALRWSSPLAAVRQLHQLLPPSFDHSQPEFSRIGNQRHVLLFSKTNGYRDYAAIAAGQSLLEQIAADRFWFVYATDNAAIFMTPTLGQFDSVVFNSVSGPLFTPEQQAELTRFVAEGGGVHYLRNPQTSIAFRKQFAERLERGSLVNREVSDRAPLVRMQQKAPPHSKTPVGQHSRQPEPVSQSPAPPP